MWLIIFSMLCRHWVMVLRRAGMASASSASTASSTDTIGCSNNMGNFKDLILSAAVVVVDVVDYV